MYIKKIKISGFKSFAEEVNIPLNEGLTGIIGPNGSGKSNILEAIKWVMGESSSKSLRGSGMNDVIFSGSASKPSKNLANVSLTIRTTIDFLSENNKKYLQDDTIEVQRQIYRDSGSTYRINGKEVKAKDIQFLFADFSSGSRSSNIIDQGSVGTLVTLKPIERRKILEEAAGISGISARKLESVSKLESTKRNLERISDILINMKDQLKELQKQAGKATDYKKAKQDLLKLNTNLSILKFKKSKNSLEHVKSQLQSKKTLMKKQKIRLENINEQKKNIESEVLDVKNKMSNLKEKNLFYNLEIEKIKLEITNNEKEKSSLKALREQINKNISFQNEILENSKARILSLEKEINGIRKTNYDVQDKESSAAILVIEKEFRAKEEKVKKLNATLNQFKENISESDYKLKILEKETKSLEEDISAFDKLIMKKNEYLIKKQENISITKKEIKIKKELDDFKKTQFQLLAEKNRISFRIKNIHKDIMQCDENIKNQQNSLLSLEKDLSSYKSLEIKTAENGIIKNIRVEKGFELAFYLAMGDGIEASYSKNSPVIWKDLDVTSLAKLPKDVVCLSKYVKAPIGLSNFLSQVGVVESAEKGEKIQPMLAPGQILVSKQGSLWRWDGLYIVSGKETLTYKRIIGATKILSLESNLNKESKKLDKLLIQSKKSKEALNKDNIQLEQINKKIENLLYNINKKNEELNNIEKDNLLTSSNRISLNKELKQLKTQIADKNNELINKKRQMEKLSLEISKDSGSIINMRKTIDSEEKELYEAKGKYDKEVIQLAIEKQNVNAHDIKVKKINEEISATSKQVSITEKTIKSLTLDLNNVEERINKFLNKPILNEEKISELSLISNKNKRLIESYEIRTNKELDNLKTINNKQQENVEHFDSLRTSVIKKEAQIEELQNFFILEKNRVLEELDLQENVLLEKCLIINEENINIKETEGQIRKLRTQLEVTEDVNLKAEADYKDLKVKYDDLYLEESDLLKASKKLEKAIEELNKEARLRIKRTFSEINDTFAKLFKKLFDGGKAYLELVDSDDPLVAGLEMMVSPPGKKLQKLSLLSGGEKALASLALIFSTFLNKKTPICILDEVDAPLDDGNVEKFCDLLKEASKLGTKRFLVITHNKITMSYMNKIFGITMMEPGISKLVSVNIDSVENVYAAE